MTVTDDPVAERSVRALLARPGYRVVALGALLWHTNRWGSLFAITLLLTREGASPLHIQVTGALFFAPMLLGAVAATAFQSVGSPRSVVLGMQLLLVPTQVAMLALVWLGITQSWITALFMLAVGTGNTVNMTSQRLLIHDTVGERHAPTAMAIDPLLSGVGSMVGAFGTGLLVARFGSAGSFGVLTLLAVGCVALTLRIPHLPSAPHRRAPATGLLDERRFRSMARAHPTLATMIAVTVVMNLCVFGYQPLVPKIAERFSDSAAVAGSLTAAVGLGQLLGGVIIASRVTRHRCLLLLAGSITATLGVAALPLAGTAPVAFATLFVAGFGAAGFGAMQSVISVEHRDPAIRAAALGAVTTAIGAMPIGMLAIGLVAQLLGARGSVLFAALLGVALLLLVAVKWRATWLSPARTARLSS